MPNHHKFMNRCYELAKKARHEGESPVGSIVVQKGKIIGEGTEKSKQLGDVTRHAEVVAILAALKTTEDLSEDTLYTNVEPCALCSYVIRHHRLQRVVFADRCGDLGGTKNPARLLTSKETTSWGNPPEILQIP